LEEYSVISDAEEYLFVADVVRSLKYRSIGVLGDCITRRKNVLLSRGLIEFYQPTTGKKDAAPRSLQKVINDIGGDHLNYIAE
jgi:hypothetical protein